MQSYAAARYRRRMAAALCLGTFALLAATGAQQRAASGGARPPAARSAPTASATPVPTSGVRPGRLASGPFTPPDGTVLLGVSTDFYRLDAFDQVAGIAGHPAIYNRWTTPNGPLAPILDDARSRPGMAPMASWNLSLADGAVAAGQEDGYLWDQAAAVKAYGGPVFIRLDWEMNATWYPQWNPPAVTPPAFIAAWRHVYEVFKSAGASNAAFVWCPTVWNGPDGVDDSAWYPGDDAVDWVGLDAYPQGASPDYLLHGPDGMDQMAEFAAAHGKPLMLAEWAPQLPKPDTAASVDLVLDWAARYPKTVKALVYFDFDNRDEGKDFLLADHPVAAAELRRRTQSSPQYVTSLTW